MIPEEQIEQVKKQLIEEINKKFPSDKKEFAKKQIISMNEKELETFLKENQLIKEETSCIFCLINEGKISSTKIEENEFASAILELNPISKGHTIIVPKNHFSKPEDLPIEITNFSEKVIEKLKNLNPKNIVIKSDNITGHEIINLIPIYEKENEKSPRKKISPEELEKILKEIKDEKIPKDECVFCSIASKKIPSKIIEENKYSLAILEINPISKGHTIILPKKHIKNAGELPAQSLSLAKKISKKIKSKLKPKEVIIYTQNLFGHEIINVLPIYKEETKDSPRKKIDEKKAEEILEKLRVKKKIIKKEKKIEIKEDLSHLPKFPTRIP